MLDLLKHQFEDAKELYADLWLGFSELEISRFMKQAGFEEIEVSVVDRESDRRFSKHCSRWGRRRRKEKREVSAAIGRFLSH